MFTAKAIFKKQFIQAKKIAANLTNTELAYYGEKEHYAVRTYSEYTNRIIRKELVARDMHRRIERETIDNLVKIIQNALA